MILRLLVFLYFCLWFLSINLAVSFVPGSMQSCYICQLQHKLNIGQEKKGGNPPSSYYLFLSLFGVGLLASVFHGDFLILLLLNHRPNFQLSAVKKMVLYNSKLPARFCFHILCMFIFTDATSPVVSILCVFVFQIWCHAQTKNVPCWLPLILILLANDIE